MQKGQIIAIVVVVAIVALALGRQYVQFPIASPFLIGESLGSGSIYQGLELMASINATTILVGQSLGIAVSLFNTLPVSNIVSSASELTSFKVTGFPIAMWSACLFNDPVEFMVVKGNYSLLQLEDLSQNTSTPSIMCMEGGAVNHFIFNPRSDVADVIGNFCMAECSPMILWSVYLASDFAIKGYWGYPLNQSEAGDLYTPVGGCVSPPVGSCGYTFNYPEASPIPQAQFTAGEYTVVVCDEWGQSVVFHFEVRGVAVSSPICIYPGQSMRLNLSVRSDSTSAPIYGANVTSAYNFHSSCNNESELGQTTQSFITNGTEWYNLYGLNDGNYSFIIEYSGHTYNFVAQLRPSVYTCAILFLPSGRSNVTFSLLAC